MSTTGWRAVPGGAQECPQHDLGRLHGPRNISKLPGGAGLWPQDRLPSLHVPKPLPSRLKQDRPRVPLLPAPREPAQGLSRHPSFSFHYRCLGTKSNQQRALRAARVGTSGAADGPGRGPTSAAQVLHRAQGRASQAQVSEAPARERQVGRCSQPSRVCVSTQDGQCRGENNHRRRGQVVPRQRLGPWGIITAAGRSKDLSAASPP